MSVVNQIQQSVFSDLVEVEDTEAAPPVFRFKFSDDVVDELTTFAQTHKYDDRSDYKEAWTKWTQDNNDIISRENTRLKQLGFEGDLIDRMYKSSRYYYRNKTTEKQEPVSRRKYVGIGNEILSKMDTQIKTYFMLFDGEDEKQGDIEGEKIKKTPANGYTLFCEEHNSEITETISRLQEGGMTHEDVTLKLKKTYKNRYYRYSRKMGAGKKKQSENDSVGDSVDTAT